MSGILTAFRESPTTEHVVMKNLAACCTAVTHCHNSIQYVMRAVRIIGMVHSRNIMLGVWRVWQESPTTVHAVKNNVTLCCTVAIQCHDSTQRVVQAAKSTNVAHNYNSMSGVLTVLRESSTTEHAFTQIAAVCCTVVTHCHNSTQHTVKVARVNSLANKCNIM
jgi:hypothetical protein